MKRFILYTTFFFPLLFAACSDGIKQRLSTQVAPLIESQYFEIVGGRDTTLISSHRSQFAISASCFPLGKNIRVELKEVFTAAEIMLSGLATQSNGQLLQSDGMFFFQASSNEKVIQPASPVKVKIPASEVSVPMQLFSGALDQNKNINWIDPRPIERTGVSACLEAGRLLFLNNCGSCHHALRDGTGPALRGVRWKEPWKSMPHELFNWVNSPAKAFDGPAGTYLLDLRTKYGSTMTPFPALSKEDINCILDYADAATGKMLEEDRSYFDSLSKRGLPNTTLWPADTASHVNNPYPSYSYPEYFDSTGIFEGSVAAYEFTVDFNGWYNIDQYLETSSTKLKPVQLTTSLSNPDSVILYQSYLLIPSEKILQFLHTEDDNKEQLPPNVSLPHGYRGIIFCIGKDRTDELWYGIQQFTIMDKQEFKIEMKKTTEEALKNVLITYRLDGISVSGANRMLSGENKK